MLGGTEILIIGGALVFMLFGPHILKNMGKAAGESIREFRNIKKEMAEPVVLSDDPRPGPKDTVTYPGDSKGN